MEINQIQLDSIRDSYQLSLMYIDNNQFKEATDQLYKVLDPIDYDLSLDIMYNYNKEYKYEELRQLILKVDDLLINYSGEEEI
jgi:hypothetical protein